MLNNLKKILKEAERVKFGRSRLERNDKRTFIDGVIFVISRLDGGKEFLQKKGYITDESII